MTLPTSTALKTRTPSEPPSNAGGKPTYNNALVSLVGVGTYFSCPWCGVDLACGQVLARWVYGKLRSITQTRRIGRHDYTWHHSDKGCKKPETIGIV